MRRRLVAERSRRDRRELRHTEGVGAVRALLVASNPNLVGTGGELCGDERIKPFAAVVVADVAAVGLLDDEGRVGIGPRHNTKIRERGLRDEDMVGGSAGHVAIAVGVQRVSGRRTSRRTGSGLGIRHESGCQRDRPEIRLATAGGRRRIGRGGLRGRGRGGLLSGLIHGFLKLVGDLARLRFGLSLLFGLVAATGESKKGTESNADECVLQRSISKISLREICSESLPLFKERRA